MGVFVGVNYWGKLSFLKTFLPDHSECGPDFFVCGNGECIFRDWMCDGTKECSDGSDESHDSCMETSCPRDRNFSMGHGYKRVVKIQNEHPVYYVELLFILPFS
eukprot:sb/3478152/